MICYCDREEQLLSVSALASYMAVHLVHELESCVRGHHIYKEVWTPVTGEVLSCARETVNLHDHFAVKVLRAGVIVGHLPKKIPYSRDYKYPSIIRTPQIQVPI